MPSSAVTPAPLVEPWSAWNVRLGGRTGGLYLDVFQCRSKHPSVEECTKTRISRPKNEKKNISGDGALPPAQNGEGTPLLNTPTPYIWRSTWPRKRKSWIRR